MGTLVRQHLRTEWKSLLLWSLVMGLLELFMVTMWESFRASGSLADLEAMIAAMPPMLQEVYGGLADFGTLRGWLQAYAFGGWLNLPLLVFVALYVTGLITREVDRHTIEFLLAQPVSRGQVLLARWISLALALMVVHAGMLAGIVAGVLAIGQTPETGTYLVAQFNSVLLYLVLGGAMLALSIGIDNYGLGLGATLGIGLGSYFLYTAGSGAEGWLHGLRSWLPYSRYSTARIIGANEFPAQDLAVLAVAALATLGLALWLFERKQISV